jgi:hypothetical protein
MRRGITIMADRRLRLDLVTGVGAAITTGITIATGTAIVDGMAATVAAGAAVTDGGTGDRSAHLG